MSLVRTDPLTGHRVIVAPNRRAIGASRPAGLPASSGRCPFCPGHEADTETTVLAIGEPWQVRIVANRFPLIDPALGAHDVVVEHREHDRDLSDYTDDEARRVLDAVQQRIAALEQRHDVACVQYFRNRGRRAGSSQPHPHGQIVALPEITPSARARQHAAADPDRALPAVMEREAKAGAIAVAGPWRAWCPPASERAWHVRIASAHDWPRFTAVPSDALVALSGLLPRLTRAALTASGTADYNLLLRDPPVGERGATFFDLLPRTGGDAGFELGSGITVCNVDPAEATERVRNAFAAG